MWLASFFDFPANLKVYYVPQGKLPENFSSLRLASLEELRDKQTIQVIKHFTKDSFYNNLHILNTIWKIFFLWRGGGGNS